MSTQQGGDGHSGASPAEPAGQDANVTDAASADGSPANRSLADGSHDNGSPADAPGEQPSHDAEILAAGGTVIGESEVAGIADRSRVRRAPRYKRFAVFGGLVGLLIAAVATPFASYDPAAAEQVGVTPWGLFLLLVVVLVPFMILVSCAVAMFTDRAARVPKRTKRKKSGRR